MEGRESISMSDIRNGEADADRLFKLAESKNPYDLSRELDELSARGCSLEKIITLQNQHGMTILHVAAKFQKAAAFNKLLKMCGQVESANEFNQAVLMRDIDGRNLLHHVARYQTVAEIKYFAGYYPLESLTQELEEKTIATALFQKDNRGETPLAIIAKRQPHQLYNVMKVARSADIHFFQSALFHEYPDGKVPLEILNQYLNIMNEMTSHHCDHTSLLWDNFFKKVDKRTFDDAVAMVSRRAEKRQASDEVNEFKTAMAALIAELDDLPTYRKNCLGACFGMLFRVRAVNYTQKQNLRNLIYNRTQTDYLTSDNIHAVQDEIYLAIGNYKQVLISNQGSNHSRYLRSLNNFLNASERNDLRMSITRRMVS